MNKLPDQEFKTISPEDAIPVQDKKPNNIGHKILYTAASGLLAIALLTGCDRSGTGGDPDPTADTGNRTGNNAPADPADEQTGSGSGSNPDGTGVVDPNGSGNGAGADTGVNNDPTKIDVDSSSTVTIETPSGSVEVPQCPGDVKPEGWGNVTMHVDSGDFDMTPPFDDGDVCAVSGSGNVFTTF